MTKEEMINNIESNQYVNGSFGVSMLHMFVGNPIVDSMVVNSYAKTSSTAFKFALDTGTAYSNNTAFGGNFIYNSLRNTKLFGDKLGMKKMASWSVRPFEKIPLLKRFDSLRNFSFNFISTGDLDKAGGIVNQAAERTGLQAKSEIVRTGFGFGRNYNDFFKTIKKHGFNVDEYSHIANPYYGKAKPTYKMITENIKNMDEKVYKEFVKKADDKSIKIFESIRKGKRKTITKKEADFFKQFAKNNKEFSGKIWNSANFGDDFLKFLNNISDEAVLQVADDFVKAGGELKNYVSGAANVVTKELKEELASVAGKKFAGRTVFQKIISSPFMRLASGAAISLPAPILIPLMVATAGVGIAASVGQDNAINNFINSNIYKPTQYDSYNSMAALSSMQSANHIRDFNLQALTNMYTNINVANRYLNDVDPISSDYSFNLDDAETL